MPGGDQLPHIAVEEGEQNGPDMRAVLIGVAEDDDLVVFQPVQAKALVDIGAQRGDEGAEFLVVEHLVDALFLGVQRLAAKGQDGLKTAVAALLGAAAGAVALYDEQLVQLRLAAGAAGQLAHQRRGFQRVLGAGHVPGLPGGFPDVGGADGLFHQLLAQLLIFQVFKIGGQLLGHDGFHQRTDFRIAQTSLGLALELGIFDHGHHDGGHALPEVVAPQIGVLVLQRSQPAGKIIHHLGVGGFEARLVAAALAGGNVVDIGEHILRVAVRILNGCPEDHVLPLALDVDGLVVEGGLILVQVFHIVQNAALKQEGLSALGRAGGVLGIFLRRVRVGFDGSCGLFRDALVGKGNGQPLVQIGQLPQAAADGIVIEMNGLKDPVVRQKADQRTPLPGVAQLLQGLHGVAGGDLARGRVSHTFEAGLIMLKVMEYIHGRPTAQGVDHGRAHAVQTAGIGVVFIVELAARVQLGEDDFGAADPHGGVDVHGHTPPVVLHAGGAVVVQGDFHMVSIAAHGFVDSVIHDLPQHMVETPAAGGADIHAWTHPHCVQPFQNLNTAGVILLCHEV